MLAWVGYMHGKTTALSLAPLALRQPTAAPRILRRVVPSLDASAAVSVTASVDASEDPSAEAPSAHETAAACPHVHLPLQPIAAGVEFPAEGVLAIAVAAVLLTFVADGGGSAEEVVLLSRPPRPYLRYR